MNMNNRCILPQLSFSFVFSLFYYYDIYCISPQIVFVSVYLQSYLSYSFSGSFLIQYSGITQFKKTSSPYTSKPVRTLRQHKQRTSKTKRELGQFFFSWVSITMYGICCCKFDVSTNFCLQSLSTSLHQQQASSFARKLF